MAAWKFAHPDLFYPQLARIYADFYRRHLRYLRIILRGLPCRSRPSHRRTPIKPGRSSERAPTVSFSDKSNALRSCLPPLTFSFGRSMIDHFKRDRLAEALRHLLSGRMDNLTFDDLDCPGDITNSEDRSLFEIFYAVWPHYDDFRAHPLQLTDGQQLDFKRCIAFLHSEAEFEWPPKSQWILDSLRRVADELTGRRFGWWPPRSTGDMSVWPFRRREDYEHALQSPRLLRGKAEQYRLQPTPR